jgi:hypothetical protein
MPMIHILEERLQRLSSFGYFDFNMHYLNIIKQPLRTPHRDNNNTPRECSKHDLILSNVTIAVSRHTWIPSYERPAWIVLCKYLILVALFCK